jgi:hypothetical protein
MGIEPSLHKDLCHWEAETTECTLALLRHTKVREVNKMLRRKITYSWSFLGSRTVFPNQGSTENFWGFVRNCGINK